MLTNRDLATLFWLGFILILAAAFPKGREIAREIGGALLVRVIVIPSALYACWLGVVVLAARSVGLWNLDLAKDTLAWFAVPGLLLLFKINDATEAKFFRKKLRQTVTLGAIAGFYLNLTALWLAGEVLLVPVMAFAVFAAATPESTPARRMGERLQTVIGLGFLVWVTTWLVSNWGSLNPAALGLSLALPIWLTVFALPFIYLFSVVVSYQSAWSQLSFMANGERVPWGSRLALLLGFRLALRDLAIFRGYPAGQLAKSKSLRDSLEFVATYRQSIRREKAAKQRAEDRLREYEGVEGTDEEGQQLDQREFEGTRDALEWVASCQRSWYSNPGGGYHRDMLEKLNNGDFTVCGLPREHGINLAVRKDRKAWYAWRRTVTGWCFAIGSAKPPPDEWRYDGPEPPGGFPGNDPTWGPISLDQTMNWPV